MKILIFGGTGFISSSIIAELLEKNNKVVVFTRGRSKNKISHHPNLEFRNGDRHNLKDLSSLSSETYDVIYDFISYEPGESKTAIKYFKGKTGRYIHCSSISVYMVSNELTLPITEDQAKAPVMPYWSRNPFGMDYGINKRRCEDVLWEAYNESSFPVTIIRPTFVSGPKDPTRRDYFWIERILDQKPILIPGEGEFKFQLSYVNDLARIFTEIIEKESTIGEAYNAASEDILTLNSYLSKLAAILEKPLDLVHVDQETFNKQSFSYSRYGDVFPFNTGRDAILSLEKIKSVIDYQSTPFEAWMAKTVDWYLNNSKIHSIGYDKRHEEISFIKSFRKTTDN